MAKRKRLLVHQRKTTVVERVVCIAGAALLFLTGAADIVHGHATVGGTRRTPGRAVFGEEAWTVGAAYVMLGSLLLLWLCRHRPWLFQAICAAIAANAVVVVLAFVRP